MADNNEPNSQNDVISTVTHALYAFESLVETEMPNIPVVYAEALEFEGALKKIISSDNYNATGRTDAIPFFAYNRTILKEVEDRHLGKRAKGKTGCIKVGDEILQYGMAYGEFDIQFMYASHNVQLQDQFEVVYNSDEGISGSKEVVVDMDALGTFKYYLDYQELTEKTINFEEIYYKLILGSIKVRGFYFTFKGSSGIIKEINQNIISSCNLAEEGQDELLSGIQIT